MLCDTDITRSSAIADGPRDAIVSRNLPSYLKKKNTYTCYKVIM